MPHVARNVEQQSSRAFLEQKRSGHLQATGNLLMLATPAMNDYVHQGRLRARAMRLDPSRCTDGRARADFGVGIAWRSAVSIRSQASAMTAMAKQRNEMSDLIQLAITEGSEGFKLFGAVAFSAFSLWCVALCAATWKRTGKATLPDPPVHRSEGPASSVPFFVAVSLAAAAWLMSGKLRAAGAFFVALGGAGAAESFLTPAHAVLCLATGAVAWLVGGSFKETQHRYWDLRKRSVRAHGAA